MKTLLYSFNICASDKSRTLWVLQDLWSGFFFALQSMNVRGKSFACEIQNENETCFCSFDVHPSLRKNDVWMKTYEKMTFAGLLNESEICSCHTHSTYSPFHGRSSRREDIPYREIWNENSFV